MTWVTGVCCFWLDDPVATIDSGTGLPVSVETCPQYLNFASEEVPDGDTRYKCAPPIRDAANRDSLWNHLVNGRINMLASDHSPAPPEMKLMEEGDFKNSWGGIAGTAYFYLPYLKLLTLEPIWGYLHRVFLAMKTQLADIILQHTSPFFYRQGTSDVCERVERFSLACCYDCILQGRQLAHSNPCHVQLLHYPLQRLWTDPWMHLFNGSLYKELCAPWKQVRECSTPVDFMLTEIASLISIGWVWLPHWDFFCLISWLQDIGITIWLHWMPDGQAVLKACCVWNRSAV